MTRYILVGGYPHKALDGGEAFVRALVEGYGEKPKILDCLFARPRENWAKAHEQDTAFFTTHLGEHSFHIQMAEVETFREQIVWADAVYIRGGSVEDGLLEMIASVVDIKKLLEGKTLAGSSAGADAMSHSFYGLDTLRLHDGLGFVPAKVIPHWMSDYNAPNIDWAKAYEELDAYKEKLPILTLREGEFKIIV